MERFYLYYFHCNSLCADKIKPKLKYQSPLRSLQWRICQQQKLLVHTFNNICFLCSYTEWRVISWHTIDLFTPVLKFIRVFSTFVLIWFFFLIWETWFDHNGIKRNNISWLHFSPDLSKINRVLTLKIRF